MKPIRVLIVDDSRMMRELLAGILKDRPGIEVVGAAADAYEARDLMRELRPDVVTLDVEMPRMNGLEFLDRLMRARPTPVVMISSFTRAGSDVTFRALELGAVEFVEKPRLDEQAPEGYAELIAEKIRAAASARLRPPRRAPLAHETGPRPAAALAAKAIAGGQGASERVIAVGASTGGTEAIREFLVGMPGDCPGIVIVQHMPEHFTRMFAERLNGLCAITVREAEHNDPVLRGHAYVAPGGRHLSVARERGRTVVRLSTDEPVNLHRPSVDYLFQSAARALGPDVVGVIMTGMGRDGARGLLAMRKAGAYNLAQDEPSCVIFGMPKEAIELGAVDEVAPLARLRERALHACARREAVR